MNLINMLYTLGQLRKNQWLKENELKNLQLMKLKRIVKHAYENVPYYHKLFNSAGVKPEDINSLEDLSRIPVTRKEVLKKTDINELVVRGTDLSKCVRERTTGSTGIPLWLYHSKSEHQLEKLTWTRANLEAGVSIFDKRCTITSPAHVVSPKTWFQKVNIWRNDYLSCRKELKEQIDILQKLKPDVICGYPSTLALIAREVKLKEIREIRPKIIFSTAEVLDQNVRNLIKDAFVIDPFDLYGCTECGLISWQCKKREGYHINIDNIFLEILDGEEPVSAGELGEVVCTNLYYYTMPIIRYAVGDMGVLASKKCSCGRTLPLMQSITGRSPDVVRLKNGRKISPFSITSCFSAFNEIFRWQFIQKGIGEFIVLLEKNRNFNDMTKLAIEGELKEILKIYDRLDIKVVEQIPCEASGKFRSIKSELT